MALFRCLKSKEVINTNTGADIGSSTTTVYTLGNTPLVAGSLSGTIYKGATAVQTFEVDVLGAFTFHDISSPATKAVAGSLHLGLGTITLTWNNAPSTNHAIVSYTGLPVYKYVTMRNFRVNCPKINFLCSTLSNAYVAAIAVCSEKLYT
jgi:hypothetical protein